MGSQYIDFQKMERDISTLKSENARLRRKIKEQSEMLSKQGQIIRDGRVQSQKATISDKMDTIIRLLRKSEVGFEGED